MEVPSILMAAIRNAVVCTDRERSGQESFGFGCILQVAAAIKETDVLLQFLRTSNSFVRSWGTEGQGQQRVAVANAAGLILS